MQINVDIYTHILTYANVISLCPVRKCEEI